MQSIERYGLITMLLLTGSFVAFAMWDPEPDYAADLARATTSAGPEAAAEAPEREVRNQVRSGGSDPAAAKPRQDRNRRSEPGSVPPVPVPDDRAQAQRDAQARLLEERQRLAQEYGAGFQAPREEPRVPRKVKDPEAALHEQALAEREERRPTDPGLGVEPKRVEPEVTPPAGTYVVQKGDVLGTIAQKLSGKASNMKYILEANPGLDADRIYAGQELKLPARWPAATTDAAAAAATPTEPTPTRDTATPPRTYVVAQNDSMWSIAVRTMGDGSLWKRIAEVNPQVDPNRLVVGQVLQLPAGAREVPVEVAANRTTPRSTAAPVTGPVTGRVR